MKEKMLTIRVAPEFLDEIKIAAVVRRQSIKAFVTDAVQRHLADNVRSLAKNPPSSAQSN